MINARWEYGTGGGTFLTIEDAHISPNGDEIFVVSKSWISTEPRHYVGMIDTKPNGKDYPAVIESDETWELSYQVTADNADSESFRLKLFVGDVKVFVERIT
jgi:hypothetical protein